MRERSLLARTFDALSDRKLWRWSIYRSKYSWRHSRGRQRRPATRREANARRATDRKMRLAVHQQAGQRELAAATRGDHGNPVRPALVASGRRGLRASTTTSTAFGGGDVTRNCRYLSDRARLTTTRRAWLHRVADTNGTATRHLLATGARLVATGRGHFRGTATPAVWRTWLAAPATRLGHSQDFTRWHADRSDQIHAQHRHAQPMARAANWQR